MKQTFLDLMLMIVLFVFGSNMLQAQSLYDALNKALEERYAKDMAIGLKYYNAKNYSKAVEWFRDATEYGSPKGQYYLGECYYYGRGVAQNYAEAAKLYRKAATQGHASAQYSLGFCYMKGQGVTQSYSQAVYWYRKSATQGDADAQCSLGVCYENGQGVTKSYPQAVYWYLKAAEQGDQYAQYNLGLCYHYSKGVTRDYSQAVVWYRKAANQGHANAKTKLNELSNYNRTNTNNTASVKEYTCSMCNGTGKCGYCHGTGFNPLYDIFFPRCPVCNGQRMCNHCSGTGRRVVSSNNNGYSSGNSNSGYTKPVEKKKIREEKPCTWCNGSGMVLKEYDGSMMSCGYHEHIKVFCPTCRKTHCRDNTRHKHCPRCEGNGVIVTYRYE